MLGEHTKLMPDGYKAVPNRSYNTAKMRSKRVPKMILFGTAAFVFGEFDSGPNNKREQFNRPADPAQAGIHGDDVS